MKLSNSRSVTLLEGSKEQPPEEGANVQRPLLNVLEGTGVDRGELFAEAQEYLREVALKLRATDPWRDAFLTFASELTYSLPAQRASQSPRARPQASR